MDILFHSDEVLELRPRSWRVFTIMGISFAVLGMIVYYFFGQSAVLACSRDDLKRPNCTLSNVIVGFTVKTKKIDGLMTVRLLESRDDEGDMMYQIVLYTESEVAIPMTSYFSSGKSNKDAIVTEIKTFLSDKTLQNLETQQGGKSASFIPLIFTGLGVLEVIAGLNGRSHIWQFNKLDGVVIHRRRGLTGIKISEYPLRDIVDAQVMSSRDSDGDTTYRIELVTISNEYIPMTSWYTSGYKKKSQGVLVIQDFLQR
jgi:hypothetical protein